MKKYKRIEETIVSAKLFEKGDQHGYTNNSHSIAGPTKYAEEHLADEDVIPYIVRDGLIKESGRFGECYLMESANGSRALMPKKEFEEKYKLIG